MRRTALFAATALLAFATPLAAQSAPSTFTTPKDWTATTTNGLTVVAPPEGDSRLVIVEVGPATDAAAAVAEGWKRYKPDFARKVKTVEPDAAQDGWEERKWVSYETSPEEKIVIGGAAARRGTNWTVVLVEGTTATFGKRGAGFNELASSIRPAGYVRESFKGKTAHALDAARIDTLKAFVAGSMKQLRVPGVGLAFIQGDKVVWEGGLGVRQLGKATPVDAHTRFMVASNTKGMMTLMLARLVDAGKVKWDQPVTEVYPAFRLGNDATTKQVLMRHLVCACTGVPRKDMDWLLNTNPTAPASSVFKQLAATQPTSGFGEVFQYNNLITSAGGYIAGRIAYPGTEPGAAFDKAMTELVFKPLDMRETDFTLATKISGNFAAPHGDNVDGQVTYAPWGQGLNATIYPARPAGAAWSSAHDMAKYAMNELLKGKRPDGTRIVSEENLLARRKPGVKEGEDSWYGMGLSITKIGEIDVIHHGGSMGGYKSDWMIVPDAGVGLVLLTNADNGRMMLRPTMRRLMEVLYDGKPEAAASVDAAIKSTDIYIAAERKKLTIPPDPAVLSGLAKRYTNPDLGFVAVGAGRLDFPAGWGSRIATKKNPDGTVSLITTDPTNEGFEFVVGTKDGTRTLTLRDAQHEYIYTEVK